MAKMGTSPWGPTVSADIDRTAIANGDGTREQPSAIRAQERATVGLTPVTCGWDGGGGGSEQASAAASQLLPTKARICILAQAQASSQSLLACWPLTFMNTPPSIEDMASMGRNLWG